MEVKLVFIRSLGACGIVLNTIPAFLIKFGISYRYLKFSGGLVRCINDKIVGSCSRSDIRKLKFGIRSFVWK